MSKDSAVKRIISLMDLTSLEDSDTPESITALCTKADTPHGLPAAVCIYPAFIETAHKVLSASGKRQNIRIATVTNFPAGHDDAARAAEETRQAAALGADEVDVVFPWQALAGGNETIGRQLVRACRETCGKKRLKVIIESGALHQPELIRTASLIAIEEGADFIKTSTGKVPVNATPEAARIMMQAIAQTKADCGFKASGGIRTGKEAQTYLDIAADIFGEDWISPAHFRFGASSLLGNLLADTAEATSGY